MKTPHFPNSSKKAFTLLEMTIVIMVLLILISIGFYSNTKLTEWKRGRTASEDVRSVYSAQRMYLADNPTATLTALSNADATALILPYLPNNVTVMPTVESLTGAQLSIRVNVSPPYVDAGDGSRYDPSGSFTDSLWDVGQ